MRAIAFLRHTIFSPALVFVFFSTSLAQAVDSLGSGATHRSTFIVSGQDSTFSLGCQFVVSGSDTVWIDSTRLQSGKEYFLDERFGSITLKRGRLHGLTDTSRHHTLVVNFQALPFQFQPTYRHREAVLRIDSTTQTKRRISKPAQAFSVDDLFGSNLQKSGSIIRGLSLGSNRDLSLSSGFRMQMSGNLSDNLEIIASLTDENTPIQPEGTTQTLQEIDKVFVQIRGTDLSATLGDFSLSLSGNEFANLNRKLQGAEGLGNYHTDFANGDVVISGATTRGKVTTNQFQGLDGVQGPYLLSGKNGERDIIVIAGTERVYVDGEQMTRGELNDYVIDYSNSEITFASRRIISAASRITVDFEYSDRQFTRNLFAARSDNKLFQDRLTLNATFFHEGDDENSPIDVTLSDTDKTVLGNAGSNRNAATRTGIDSVGSGKGQYVRQDTMVFSPDSSKFILTTVYKYAPQDSLNAVYTITFSFVGQGNGDYSKISVGLYQFVGIRQGSYASIRFLPVPQSQSLADLSVGYQVMDNLAVTGEYAASKFDANLFSSKEGVQQDGTAMKFGIAFSPKNVRIGKANLGSFDFDFKERYINKNFVPIDRINEIEYNRKWNITDSSSADEQMREGTVTYKPVESVALAGGYGSVERGNSFSSDRYTGNFRLAATGLPKASYDVEDIRSRDASAGNTAAWLRQKATAEDSVGHSVVGLRFDNEDRESRAVVQDTLEYGSFRFDELAPRLSLSGLGLMSVNSEIGWRWEDSLAFGALRRASTTFSQHYGWQLSEWHSLSSMLDFTIRNRTFSDVFKKRNNSDVKTVVVRSQTRYSPFNRGVESEWFYEIASDRTAKLERVFQRVPIGTGNYVYVGDVNGNHIVDEPDFQLTRFDGDFIAVTVPSDQLIPVTDLKASTRVRLNGSRLVNASSSLGKIASALSTETYARVEEKSSDPDTKQIYFLHLSHFLNDLTTLEGTNIFSQDLYVLENDRTFSMRLRYLQQKGLTQFALQNERTYSVERSIRVRWSLVKEFANQTDFVQKSNILSSNQLSYRVRNVLSNGLTTDWSYRPEQNIELGFIIGVERASNCDTTVVNINDQSVRFLYSFQGKGQGRVEFTREEALANKALSIFPFELTEGKNIGKTWLWRVSFDYRLTQFIQSTLSYDGRNEAGSQTIHTARGEVRAFF